MASMSLSLTPRKITGAKRSDTITVQGGGLPVVSADDGSDSNSTRLDGVPSVSGGAGTAGLTISANVSATRPERGADGSITIRSLSQSAANITVQSDVKRIRSND